MSTMDRAFIKAYADDVSPSHHDAAPVRGASSRGKSVTAPSQPAPQSAPTMVVQMPAARKPAVTAPAQRAPAPVAAQEYRGHMPKSTRDIYESEARESTSYQQPAPMAAPQSSRSSTAKTEKKTMPLSSYTTQVKEEQRFRAGLEVDYFVWPDICNELASNEHLFDGIAEELIDQAARGNKVIGVTSCVRGEGRTTLLLCVARRLASSGVKVCMVDADLESPQLARSLGLSIAEGWELVITGELAVTEVLVNSLDDRLTLFPLAQSQDTNSELETEHFSTMMGILRDHFDIVLVDTCPLLEGNPVCGLLTEPTTGIDATVIVSHVQETAPDQLRQAQRLVNGAGHECIGIAENFNLQ